MSANPPKQVETVESIFGKPIYTYTRAQALADGFQVEVTETAREAGIRFRTFINRSVYDAYVKVPPGVRMQDEAGRLWDVLWMTANAMRKAAPNVQRIAVPLYVRNTNGAAKLITLAAMVGPLDMDNPEPAITIMLHDED